MNVSGPLDIRFFCNFELSELCVGWNVAKEEFVRSHLLSLQNPAHDQTTVKETLEKNLHIVDDYIFKVRTDASDDLSEKTKLFEEQENTLHVIIHDEAHYAATYNGGAHLMLNDDDVRCPKKNNVITLCVSATPYNLQTNMSQIPEQNLEFHDIYYCFNGAIF